jgi:hypothetical protein
MNLLPGCDSVALDAWFARDYRGAHRNFANACAQAGIARHFMQHPAVGPDGETIGISIARLGPIDADRILVILSGVHGPELMCGSAIQSGLLLSAMPRALPADTAVLMVHAVNPWGAAHGSRTNEDNIDLCRNFVDFGSALPVNSGYRSIAAAFHSEPEAGDELLADYARQHGSLALNTAMWGGQYEDPTGFSFGGHAPAWSRIALETLLREHVGRARRIVVVDCHSGVGPYGYGLAVCMQAGAALDRVRKMFGRWVLAPREPGAGDYYPVTGHTSDGYESWFTDRKLSAIVLEFGTYEMQHTSAVMREELRMRRHGDSTRAPDAIKADVVEAYCPDDPAWRYAVWTRALQVVEQSLAGLHT